MTRGRFTRCLAFAPGAGRARAYELQRPAALCAPEWIGVPARRGAYGAR